jgi:hypothetical protein
MPFQDIPIMAVSEKGVTAPCQRVNVKIAQVEAVFNLDFGGGWLLDRLK